MATPRRSEALASLFPDGVVVFELGDSDVPPPVRGVEEEAIARAVPPRRAEFARGRACARAALAVLGLGEPDLPMGPSRAPVWPAGVAGSITHCRGLVAAAVGRIGDARSLGLDAEPRESLEADVAQRIATPEEIEAARRATGCAAIDVPRLVFSAKEVVHKCVHPLTGVVLDFLDVVLVFDGRARGFRVEAASERARRLDELARLSGRYRVGASHLVTAGVVSEGGQRGA